MTTQQLARMLKNKHAARSWRKISREDYYGIIPAGTLAEIAKRDGKYCPVKWAHMLGITSRAKSTRKKRAIADMTTRELRFAFEHRENF